MREKSKQKHFVIILIMESGKRRLVNVVASSEEVARRRALKFTPGAVKVAVAEKDDA